VREKVEMDDDKIIATLLTLALNSETGADARAEAVRSLAELWHGGGTTHVAAGEALRRIAAETDGEPQLLAIKALGGRRL